MEKWVNNLNTWYNSYCDSFTSLSDEQKRNFEIKRNHSFRVADLSVQMAGKLDFSSEDIKLAYFIGLFHDIGRYKQLVEFNTFNDTKSVNHAEYSVEILQEEQVLEKFEFENKDIIFSAIRNHNKFEIPKKLPEQELRFVKLVRDADKMDILKVITEYYTNRKATPNHTLTWELPKGNAVSKEVSKEILAGKLVSKKNVMSEIDVKIMQLSWVFDINYKPTFKYLLRNRFLENIYSTLPKNDVVIEIYTKVKVYSENRILPEVNRITSKNFENRKIS